MIVKVNKKVFNNEFKKTHLKCTLDLDVYFDYDKCKIIFKTKKSFKALITLILPLYFIVYIVVYGISSSKDFLYYYMSLLKEDVYKNEWIMSEKSWIYKSMCKVLKKESLLKKEVV